MSHAELEQINRSPKRSRTRRYLTIALSILAVLIAVGLFCRYRYSAAMSLDTTVGINEAMYVPIGGTEQWVQIRGRDRKNPVLLWLNGGPGFSTIPQTYLALPLEEEFTVVMWDQRGEGLSYARTGPSIGPTMSVDRMVNDGIELAQFLRKHLGVPKVAILGHSWGSILGVHMAQRRPDLFSAYIGTGQVVDVEEGLANSYPSIVQQARAAGAEPAVKELAANGPPPYEDIKKYLVPLKWANEFDATTATDNRRLDPGRLWAMFRMILRSRTLFAGATFSQDRLLRSLLEENIPAVGTTFALPVVFVQGSEDMVTPAALVQDYFDQIVAPDKKLIVLPGSGHLAILSDREAFNRALHEARPLITAALK
jgi:pimeloyl-ACP methyl ester carboxylesterase